MNGCEYLKCEYWNGAACTDKNEYVNDSGPCCGRRADARSVPAPAPALEVDYKAMLERIVMLVNPVTSAHRHGMSIMDRVSQKHLDDLCNYQIECDAALTGRKGIT